jgi:hypothetical protein
MGASFVASSPIPGRIPNCRDAKVTTGIMDPQITQIAPIVSEERRPREIGQSA